MWAHSTGSASGSRGSIWVGHVGALKLALSRKHHEPLVVLFRVLLFELARFLEGDVRVLDRAQIGAPISLNNDKITSLYLETGVLLDVKYVGAVAFECDNIQQLVLVSMR